MKVLATLALFTTFLSSQQPASQQAAPAAPATPPVAEKPLVEEKPILSKHEIHANGKSLSYAAAGMMPIRNAQGEIDAKYTFSHKQLHTSVRKNVVFQYYNAGHMFYIDVPSHRKLKGDITQFIKSAL